LSLYLANTFNWHIPFFALGFCSIFVLTAILFVLPTMRDHLSHKATPWTESFTRVFTSPKRMGALFFLFCLVMGQFTIIPYVSTSLVANAGFEESDLPLIYIFGGIASFVSSPLAGRLSDLFGKPRIFQWSVVFSVLPILWITHLGQGPLFFGIFACVLFFISMAGRMVPAMALITESTDPAHRGSFMSFVSSVQQISAAFASLLAGHIVSRATNGSGTLDHYSTVGWIASGFSLLALVVVRGVFKFTPDANEKIHSAATDSGV
ncbi:MAG: MFS transporter, partial [Bdellovibrio sp.]